MQNRRRETRYRVRLKGVLHLEGQSIRIQTENLSVIGARVVLDRPLLEGAAISLALVLSKDEAPVELSGSVVWCTEDMDAGFQAGISFAANASTARRLIERFVDCPAA